METGIKLERAWLRPGPSHRRSPQHGYPTSRTTLFAPHNQEITRHTINSAHRFLNKCRLPAKRPALIPRRPPRQEPCFHRGVASSPSATALSTQNEQAAEPSVFYKRASGLLPAVRLARLPWTAQPWLIGDLAVFGNGQAGICEEPDQVGLGGGLFTARACRPEPAGVGPVGRAGAVAKATALRTTGRATGEPLLGQSSE